MYHATLNFLNKGLRNLAIFCAKHTVSSVALPKVGAGLGKLDWETEVKPLMQTHFAAGDTSFFVYEDFKQEYEQNSAQRDKRARTAQA